MAITLNDFFNTNYVIGGLNWETVSTNTNAERGKGYLVDTISSSVTITLPSSPLNGDIVAIADAGGNFSTNLCTVGRNGQNIMGLAEDMTISRDNISIELMFIDGYGWRILTATGIEGPQGLPGGDLVVASESEALAGVSNTVAMTPAKTALLVGRKNYIINGNFDVWQRGTSLTSGTGQRFLADRWLVSNSLSSYTTDRMSFTPGQTDVPHEPYFWHRTTVSSVSGGSVYLRQKIEGVRTLAGQTATLSFYAKSTAPVMEVVLTQWFGSGGTPSAFVNTSFEVVTLGGDWNRYSLTFSIPSIAGKTLGTSNDDALMVTFWFDNNSSSIGNQSGTFDIAQVQLEKGSFATDFEQRHIGEELALCQRYYEIINTYYGGGVCYKYSASSTIGAFNSSNTFIEKRTTPTVTVTGTISYTNCSDLVAIADRKSVVTRVTVDGSAVIYRALGANVELDAEL
jgi:hypothetical protein